MFLKEIEHVCLYSFSRGLKQQVHLMVFLHLSSGSSPWLSATTWSWGIFTSYLCVMWLNHFCKHRHSGGKHQGSSQVSRSELICWFHTFKCFINYLQGFYVPQKHQCLYQTSQFTLDWGCFETLISISIRLILEWWGRFFCLHFFLHWLASFLPSNVWKVMTITLFICDPSHRNQD